MSLQNYFDNIKRSKQQLRDLQTAKVFEAKQRVAGVNTRIVSEGPNDGRRTVMQTMPANASPQVYMPEGSFSYSPELNFRVGNSFPQSLRKYSDGSFSVVQVMQNIWTQAVQTRRDYIQVSEELRRFYLVDRILQQIARDVLNADDKGEIVTLKSENPKFQKTLDDLQEKWDFNTMLREFTKDFVDYGEYTFRMTTKLGEGVVGIHDDLNQTCVVAFYEQGSPKNYLVYDGSDYKVLPPNNFANFVIDTDKIRVALKDQLVNGYKLMDSRDIPEEVEEKLPDYVRIGRPMLFGIVSKLRELQILETLVVASKLNQITQSQIVSMKIPASMPPEETMKQLNRYEQLLNTPTNVDTMNEQVTLAEILTVAGKIRIIPNFSDEKGSLEALNVRQNIPVDDVLKATNDLRNLILTSVGIPPSLIFGSMGQPGEGNKASELRMYGMYTRKLAEIQRALAQGLKQIALAHLCNIYAVGEVSKKDITVSFKQSLVDISGLEKNEFDDAKQEIVSRRLDFVAKIMADPLLALAVDKMALLKWVGGALNNLSDGESLFNLEEDNQELMDVVSNRKPLVPTPTTPGQDQAADTDQVAGGAVPPPKPVPKPAPNPNNGRSAA